MPKNDVFVGELTESRKKLVVACWGNVADAWYFRGVRFERLRDGTLEAMTNVSSMEARSDEQLADAVAHAKRVRAELAERIPELAWTDELPPTRFGVVYDYGEAALGVAMEVDGRILSWTEWCELERERGEC